MFQINLKLAVAVLLVMFVATGCVVIEDGEVGVSKSFGKIKDEPVGQGVVIQVPVIRTVETWNVKLQELKETAQVPSSRGLDRRPRYLAALSGAAREGPDDSADGGLELRRAPDRPVLSKRAARRGERLSGQEGLLGRGPQGDRLQGQGTTRREPQNARHPRSWTCCSGT